MEEDAGVNAPVTRRRRRLSMEQLEESKSPAPSTPTKRRAGRRVQKPELDLIDENAQEDYSQGKAKKTITKDIIDEEKPLTPSRRSTRIKSNTSIISETAVVDSPRAKRATRRTSQVGSDNETPITPARQTRRTRKDSATSIDKVENQSLKQTTQITEVITEEPETTTRKSSSKSEDIDNKIGSIQRQNETPNSLRKSPRLLGEKSRRSTSTQPDTDKSTLAHDNLGHRENRNSIDNILNKLPKDETIAPSPIKHINEGLKPKKDKDKGLSLSTCNLIDNIDKESKKKTSNMNKSTSSLYSSDNLKSKRHRSKSFTNVQDISSGDSKFFSDNESHKKKIKDYIRSSLKVQNKSGSGDGISKNSQDKLNNSSNDSKFFSDNESLKKKIKNYIRSPLKLLNKSGSGDGISNNSQGKLNKSLENKNEQVFNALKNNKNNIVAHSKDQIAEIDNNSNSNSRDRKNSSISDFFGKNPSVDLKTTVLIEDSDSNSEKLHIVESNSEDQRVPEIQQATEISKTKPDQVALVVKESLNCTLNESKDKSIANDSCEPMEVDETIHGSLIITEVHDEELHTSKFKQESNISLNINVTTNESNKSKRKSSISHTFNKSENQSKSTLILSQVKDTSANDINDVTKSPQISEKRLSKSIDRLNLTQENAVNKKISLSNYLTSTPLQTSKPTIERDTDKESSNGDTEDKFTKKTTRNECVTSEESDNETSSQKNNFLDIEAEDAGDDYESGDSRNEDEKQYERDNEILEKGETLSSDDELSNDSEYEKDSFVVSSDEQDNELLDGSDNDLSLSDNELKMTSKSKKKYDERKQKEQKNASREMFESRHKLNKSNDNECRLDSSESDEEILTKPRKKNKLRLDSSHEVSNIEDNNSSKQETNKTLSESGCNESAIKEIEITCQNESYMKTDPLSTTLIKEDWKTFANDKNETLAFIDAENVNETKVCCNEVLSKGHRILDPLEATKDDDDSSLSSDNEKIMQSYDFVLDQLNKSKTEKITKFCDISLNLDKKEKKKEKKTVIDELNLTQVKSIKKSKIKANDRTDIKKDNYVDEDNSSDSIDLHLLFSEDSSNIEETQSEANKVTTDKEKFIPLKKVEGRTDIREEKDTSKINKRSSINESNKSDMKRKSKNSISTDHVKETSVQFFIDTKGTYGPDQSIIESLDTSCKSIKNKSKTIDSDSDAPMEISFKSDKNKAKDTSVKLNNDENSGENEIVKTPGSGTKKKKNNSESHVEQTENDVPTELSHETYTSCAKKKKNISISEENSTLKTNKEDNINETLTASTKNKKKKNSISEQNASIRADKDNEPTEHETSTNGSKKKQKKISLSEANTSSSVDKGMFAELSEEIVTISAKKKKKISVSEADASKYAEKYDVPTELETSTSSSKKKQKKIPLSEDASSNAEKEEHRKEDKVQKRKRKLSEITREDALLTDNNNDKFNESGSIKKKKQKIKHKSADNESEQVGNETQLTTQSSNSKKSKKEDEFQTEEQIQYHKDETATKKNKNKKRKEREDDDVKRRFKILKENSFGNVHITRLPSSVLEQLDDKTKMEALPVLKRSKIIATTEFLVEETRTRKNKPSKYLEESIYLNDEDLDIKKRKHATDKPKVLPFVPTASTSNNGYTTNFKVNIIPHDIKFVAKSNSMSNFKNDHLYNKKIKRMGTYELYKRNRNIKISKF